MYKEWKKIYKNVYPFGVSSELNMAAYDFALSKPKDNNYNADGCEYAQQGVSYWIQTTENYYPNLNISHIALLFSSYEKPIVYTCNTNMIVNEAIMKERPIVGLGILADYAKNPYGNGMVDGVQVWVLLFWDLLENYN